MLKRITITEAEKIHPHIREANNNIHSGLWLDIDSQELEFYNIDCSTTIIVMLEENVWTFDGIMWRAMHWSVALAEAALSDATS